MAVCGLLMTAGAVMHGADGVPIFKTGVDLVALNVIVTDSQQKLVSGLGVQDFAVFEDGVQREGDRLTIVDVKDTVKVLHPLDGNFDAARQAILIDFDDVMEIAKQAGVAVYTITLRSDYDSRQASAGTGRRDFSSAEFSMRALAQETGARAFFPASITELAGVYDSIAQELASQYALGYTSPKPERIAALQ